MYKYFLISIFALLLFIPAVSYAQVAPLLAGIEVGDLVKLPTDNDPATVVDSIVYYFDRDWKRHPFPNKHVYDSWYADFSTVKEITPEQMSSMMLGKSIVYRPGTRLIKIPSIPKVYAVEPNGVLRWITSEEVALGLYGADWSKKVDDVGEAFFIDYTEGSPLRTVSYPTGTVVRRNSDTATYMIEGDFLRYIRPTDIATYRIQDRYTIHVDELPTGFTLEGNVSNANDRLIDTSQLSFVETLSTPQIDYHEEVAAVVVGTEQVLATMRVTAGAAVLMRGLTVRVHGELWDGSTARLQNLKMVVRDTDPETETFPFGVRQLMDSGTDTERITFTGAFTVEENTEIILDFVADIGIGFGDGIALTVDFENDAFLMFDGLNTSRSMFYATGGDYGHSALMVE